MGVTTVTEQSLTHLVDLADRFAASAREVDSTVTPNVELAQWYAERQRDAAFEVTRIPLADLVGWTINPQTGTLAHDSGRFFTVEGLRVQAPGYGWEQPILVQREIGILGILVKEFDGVLHCLMQAKVEPGNTGGLRLSPTVNATRTNYTGRQLPYVDAFVAPREGQLLVDTLQSERSAWFLRKRNRHMVVEVTEPVQEHPDFRWLTLGQLRELLRRDRLLSMEACSVLSCLPVRPSGPPCDEFGDALLRSFTEGGRLRTREVVSRLIEIKAREEVGQRRIPLNGIADWRITPDGIARPDGRYFAVVGARVAVRGQGWTQPLLAPVPGGVAALLTRDIDGVLHLLLAVRVEAGAMDVAELGPTVLCTPDNYRDDVRRPHFLDYVLSVAPHQIRYDAAISEEGARFYHAHSRYLVIDTGPDFPVEVPDDYVWVTAGQAGALLQHSYYLNMQLRTLMAVLPELL
jgi:NDP-hexose 2,3-dehydratase.